MKILCYSMILTIVTMSVLCFILSDAHAQDCMGGQFCGGNTQSSTPAKNENMTLSMNFYSNSTMPNNVHYLWLRFSDAKNNTLIKNVSFFINATKDNKVLMHELFHTKTGLMLMKFYPTHDTEKLIINGTSDPVLGGMMSENDTLSITTSVFAEQGTYHIHLEALALVNGNELVDQNNPPTFDSWWSVDDNGNISKYDDNITDTPLKLGNPSVMNAIQSPLRQFNSGTNTGFITCKSGSYFVLKSYDREPLCLKAGTISKLASRGFLFAASASTDNHATVIISPRSENQASPNTYSPDVITVVLGVNNTIRWVNQADVANTIVPDMPLIQNGKSFGSDGVIKPDQSYAFTFTEPGTFTYHTDPHPWMKGTVIVLPRINTDSHTSVGENTALPASFEPCDTPYPQSNTGVAVLYMPVNSTGKICVQYSNSNPPQSTGLRIFEAHHIDDDTQDITSYATPDKIQTGNSTIVYTVKTTNHVGFYGLTIFCVGMPFAVGYDNTSTFVPDDFPWLGGTYYCPAQLYNYHIVGLSGIGVKSMPYP